MSFAKPSKQEQKVFCTKSEAARSLKDAVEALQRGQQFVTSQNWDRPIEGPHA